MASSACDPRIRSAARLLILARGRFQTMDAPTFAPELQAVVKAAPDPVLVLDPAFTIVAVNDALLAISRWTPDALLGRNLFEAFPDNPDDPQADGSANLRASLERVLETCKADTLEAQRYDVRLPADEGGTFERRYWNVSNYPVLDEAGRARWIVHQARDVTELVALRRHDAALVAELAEANAQFQAVYDQGLFAGRLDLEGRLTDANRSSLELCGYTRDEVMGRFFWDCGWWNRSADVQEWIKGAIRRAAAGEPFRGISPYFLADGSERTVDFACMPLRDPSGAVALLMVTGMDITQRTHDELRERATEILESITDGFFALDRAWRFTYVNRQGQHILGRSRSDLIGRSLWECYPGLEGSEFERAYRTVMDGGEVSPFTSYYAAHERWYEVHPYPARDGISVYFRNVTERVAVEAERERLIAESERQRLIYEAALSNTPDLVYVFDLDHRFTYANEALLKMWGLRREDALGKSCHELGYEPWHAEMHDREIDEVIATRRPIRGEVPFTGTGGRRIYDYIFVPVIGADGKVVAVAGTTRDVTERQQAEQEIRGQAERLRESDKAKDEFLATLAHELRNPLAPIANSIELMKRDHADGEISARARATMERQVRHLVRLVDDLLDVSRITRGHLELRRQQVKLASIVEQAVEASRPQIDAAGHTLTVTVPEETVWLDADPVRLVQVVGNLLNNASKYTPRGGRVELGARCAQGMAEISVRDNGVGIAPEMLERVFDMFTRAEQSLENTRDGLGVGLTLARRLVEMHGGTMVARSEGRGRGSEFTMKIPCVLEGGADAAAAPEDAGGVARRVLVVDDNVDAASSLAALLELSGNETRTAHDGAAAVTAAAEFRPDVILLDIGLPGMNGYDACRAIRRLPGGEDVLVVALTGWGQVQDRKSSSEAGFDTHLVKPADYSKLLQIIATEPRAARERT